MELFIKIAQMMLVLMFLVMIHEWGHYITARWFGVRVEKFFIFFDVKFALWKKKIGETVYGIGWLPLGGYVKLSGMIDESLDTEQMKGEPEPYEFRAKPAWQRLIIMLGGIIVNLIFAIFMFGLLFFLNGKNYTDVTEMKYGIVADSLQTSIGLQAGDIPVAVDGVEYKSLQDISIKLVTGGNTLTVKRNGNNVDLPIDTDAHSLLLAQRKNFFSPREKFEIDSVVADKEAARIGLKKGDKIVEANGKQILFYDDISKVLSENKNKSIEIKINRNGEILSKTANINECGTLGFVTQRDQAYLQSLYKSEKLGFFSSLGNGFTRTFGLIGDQVNGIKLLFKVKDGTKHLAGPLGIVKQMPSNWDWEYLLPFAALLSAWLAFMNLLPIPALDGGHAVICIYEIISGKKPNDKVMEYIQISGVIIMFALMIFIFGNDIWNWISSSGAEEAVTPKC